MAMWRYVLAVLALGLASGCGIKQSMDDTDAKISVFHADLDNARFGEIWNQTSPTLRKAASEKVFLALMEGYRINSNALIAE